MKCHHLLICLALLALAACGQIRHVFPPNINIEQLDTPAQGDWTATLRLHNQSYDAGVRFDRLQLDVSLGGVSAGSITRDISIDVAERSSDVVEASFTPSTAARDKLAQSKASGNGNQLQYAVKGSATISDEGKNSGTFDIDHSGWLSPVPGVDHLYR